MPDHPTSASTTTHCWLVRWGTEEDEVAHFPSQEKAEAYRDGFLAAPADITQLDHECHVITCPTPGCGRRFDEDGDGVVHFPSREEAVRWVLLCDWSASENGPVCPGCVEDGYFTP